jgi:hypothetical protein
MTGPADQSFVEWGVASRPSPGERSSGDIHVLEALPGVVLAAVLDGLGHGEAAAVAARQAASVLARHVNEPLAALVRRCHRSLTGTRGVVMSVARIRSVDDTMSWIGVGNVEGAVLRTGPNGPVAVDQLLLRGGVVGLRVPPLQESVVSLRPADLIIFATDGVRQEYAESLVATESAQRLADTILAHYGKSTDDGLVLVGRYRGA